VSSKPRRWETLAHIGTIVSSLAATVALLVSSYQFRETVRIQEQSIKLQNQALRTERASKAAEIFEKFLEVRYRRTELPDGPQRKRFMFERNNRALMFLNALYETSKGDQQWEDIIHYSLQYFDAFARERQVICLSLTEDFKVFMLKNLPNAPQDSWKICHDLTEAD
jgi:hypothetical protein